MFDTVLVANRGEIAVRVIRTLRRLGVRSVAVHSPADADAPHVRAADTAVLLGDGASSSAADTYLAVERLLDAAARTGAQAVHPGYGFLAENAAFARACADAGLVFIGPPPSAIELMGDKIHAKEAVSAAGVPVVPGSEGAGLDDAHLTAAAREIGLPVLLKPSAGGGGKGMRLIRDEAELADGIASARREARAAFGDDTLLLERWIDRPRHIEIQVLADAHGTTVHLGERECSLQRRHQKLVEEAPSVLLDPATRAAMGAAAVRAAASCGYTGAGTVEFIVPSGDPSSFYFMEMNTRLQVEHPVTELAVRVDGTGPLDLVEWQLRVAAGEPLTFRQDDVSFGGHAIEARVCAETPVFTEGALDFLPTGGRVLLLDEPGGEGVRVDSGLAPGTEVGTAYDPMLAKVIAHGPDRATALRRLRAALAETRILGVTTNTGYLRRLLAHPDVVSGTFDTGLVGRHPELAEGPAADRSAALCAAALARQLDLAPATDPGGWTDPFSLPSGWRLGAEPAWTTHRLRASGHEPVTVRVRPATPSNVADPTDNAVRTGSDQAFEVRIEGTEGLEPSGHTARAVRDGRRLLVTLDGTTTPWTTATDPATGALWLAAGGETWSFTPYDPVAERMAAGPGAAAGGGLTAPMPGTVTVVKAAVGERVTKGQPLLVLEAMKMEHVIAAPCEGVLEQLRVRAGSTVGMDELLAVVTPDEAMEERS